MSIEIDDYISEEKKLEVALEVFKGKIHEAFGGDQYSDSGKERDRVVRNAVAHWITEYIEKTLTDEDKEIIKKNVSETITSKKDLSFYIFTKPDVWDRTEYTAHKVITQAVKDNEAFIKDKVDESIKKKFSIEE